MYCYMVLPHTIPKTSCDPLATYIVVVHLLHFELKKKTQSGHTKIRLHLQSIKYVVLHMQKV